MQVCACAVPAGNWIDDDLRPEQAWLHVAVANGVPIANERPCLTLDAETKDHAPSLLRSSDALSYLLDARRLMVVAPDQGGDASSVGGDQSPDLWNKVGGAYSA
jgi:hypothetical protein